MINLKCVLVGNNGVGKRSMMSSYSSNTMTNLKYNVEVNVMVDGKPADLQIHTINKNDTKEKRFKIYEETDIFLICFDIMNKESFESVESIWTKEIIEYMDNNIGYRVPHHLIGNKEDLRNIYHNNYTNKHSPLNIQRSRLLVTGYIHKVSALITTDIIEICHKYYHETIPISTKQGSKMMETIDAIQYIENSALTQNYLKVVFDDAIRTARLCHVEGIQYIKGNKGNDCHCICL